MVHSSVTTCTDPGQLPACADHKRLRAVMTSQTTPARHQEQEDAEGPWNRLFCAWRRCWSDVYIAHRGGGTPAGDATQQHRSVALHMNLGP